MKFSSSVSMSGPSATAKPISAKIAVISSMTWLIGWIRPRTSGASRTGRVTSTRSEASRASRAASASSALRAVTAPCTRSRRPLIRGPRSLRSSGVIGAQGLQQIRDAALLAERRDAHRVEGRLVGRRASPGPGGRVRGCRDRSSLSSSRVGGVAVAACCRASGAADASRGREPGTTKARLPGRAAPSVRPAAAWIRRPWRWSAAARPWPSRRRRRSSPARGSRARTAPCGRRRCPTWPGRR